MGDGRVSARNARRIRAGWSTEHINVNEAAALEHPDVYTIHDYRDPSEWGTWCGSCGLPSVCRVERVAWCVDADGVTAVLIGAWWFCTEEQSFVERAA